MAAYTAIAGSRVALTGSINAATDQWAFALTNTVPGGTAFVAGTSDSATGGGKHIVKRGRKLHVFDSELEAIQFLAHRKKDKKPDKPEPKKPETISEPEFKLLAKRYQKAEAFQQTFIKQDWNALYKLWQDVLEAEEEELLLLL